MYPQQQPYQAYGMPVQRRHHAYVMPQQQQLQNYPVVPQQQRVNQVQGVTITWNVNAHVKTEQSFIKRIKNRFSRAKPADNINTQYQMPYNPYYPNPNYNPNMMNQSPTPEDTGIKKILKNVSGIVRPGQLCAIMGASGSGKTTLLNILNCRNQGKMIVDADIKVNGNKVGWEEITKVSGYVQQLDLFIGTLTVKEQLTLYAMLKMDNTYTQQEKYDRVDKLVNQLNLVKCQDTRIGAGDMMKGISGGEKRRLAFGSEIVTNPSLLFCDEPTSGLDSFMAETVVDLLLDLTRQNKTMVCVIHQPSSQIFEKFDTLCLLSEGRVAYMGPTKEAYNHFSKLGYRCPNTYNPADYYIQVLAIKPQTREQSLAKAKRVCDAYDNSEYSKRTQQLITQVDSNPLPLENDDSKGRFNRSWYAVSFLTQTRWLLWREFLNVIRNPVATYVLLGQAAFIGIFFGLTYLNITLNEIGVQNIIGLLFLILMQSNFSYFFAVANSLPLELPVLYREVRNRLYSVFVYFAAKNIADLPKYILTPFLAYTIIFWMADISRSASVFFAVGALFVLTTQCAVSFALFLSALAPNLDVVLALAIPVLMPMLIFAGLFLNNDSTPDYLVWVKYISWFFYTNEAIQIEYWTSIDSIPCSKNRTAVDANQCLKARCYDNGKSVLDELEFKESNLGRDVGLSFLIIVVYRILAVIVLKLKTMKK